MAFLDARDTISGKEGKAFAVINGNVKELLYAKNVEAKIEKSKSEIKVIGRRAIQHKATGWNGTGNMTIYYITSLYREMVMQYIKTGRDVYFDLQVINEDPASAAGKQTVILKNCNINGTIIAKLDIDSDDPLDEELEFTFEDVEILDSFSEISI